MRTTRIVLLTVACGLLAGPLRADKRVDDAVAKAEDQIQKGKTEEAVKTIQKLVSQPSAEAFTAAARLQIRMGKVEEANTSAAEAVKLAGSATPDVKAAALAIQSRLDLLRGTGKDAVANAQKAVEAQSTPAALAALARAQVRVQDPAALATAEKAVAAGASSADAQEAQGEALLAAGKAAEAQAAFAKALAADPRMTAARVGTARALLAQNKGAEAVAEARKATEENPNDGEAFAVLGLGLLAQGNWNEAISAAQEGKFKNDRNPVVLAAVGKIFEDPKAGNIQQATSAYQAATAVDPDFIPVKVALVTNLERLGKNDEALAEARKLAQQMPNSPDVQLLLGRIALRKGDFLGAVQPLETAAKSAPNNAEVQAMYGTALFNTRQPAEALDAYKKAVALAPDNADYATTYGLLLAMNDKPVEAISILEKVVAKPGYKNTNGFTNLGYAYRNAEPPQAEKSAAAYQKAVELDPKNAQAALGLGWALTIAQKYDVAIPSFAKAVELDAKLAGEAHNGTAWDYYFKKDMVKAKEFTAKAKAEGRNVDKLVKTIDDFEKGIARAEDAQKQLQENQKAAAAGGGGGGIDACARTIMRGAPAERRTCATEMRKYGKAAVEYLIYAVFNDRDFGVRSAAVQSLGAIGDKSVCGQLRQLANNNPYEKTIMSPEEQQQFVRYEDFRKVVRAAVAQIGC